MEKDVRVIRTGWIAVLDKPVELRSLSHGVWVVEGWLFTKDRQPSFYPPPSTIQLAFTWCRGTEEKYFRGFRTLEVRKEKGYRASRSL